MSVEGYTKDVHIHTVIACFVSDHVTARWEGVPLNSQSALIDADDGATVITDTIKDDAERQEPKSCPQQTVKVIDLWFSSSHLLCVKQSIWCWSKENHEDSVVFSL